MTLRDVLELVALTPEELLETEVRVGVQRSSDGRVWINGTYQADEGAVGPCVLAITIWPEQA